MFALLLLVTFIIAAGASFVTAVLFAKPINKVLTRLVSEELAPVWKRYILYAIYVVGISGGVRVWEMERYITPDEKGYIVQLNSDRWFMEMYKTIISSLQGVAWMLLVFFLFALVAYVVVKGFEGKKAIK